MKRILSISLLLFSLNGILCQEIQVEIQTGHTGGVNSVDLSPDGRRFISGSGDNSIILWDIESGRQVRKFTGHHSSVYAVKYSPDGKTFASASSDFLVKLWEVETGIVLKTFKGHFHELRAVNFSPDGKYIASAGFDKTIKIWEVETGKLFKTLWGHRDIVLSLCFNDKGDQILSGSYDNTAKLWDIESGEVISTFFGHKKSVNSAAFGPDKKKITTASHDETIRIWDIKTRNCVKTLAGHSSFVKALQFYNEGKNLVSGDFSDNLIFWDVKTGKQLKKIKTTDCSSISINSESQKLILNGKLSLLDLNTYELIKTFKGYILSLPSFSIHPNGKEIISGGYQGNLKLWNLEKGSLESSFSGHTYSIFSVDFSSDGQNFISAGKKVLLWHKNLTKPVKELAETTNEWLSISYSMDGEKIAAGCSGKVVVFNANRGEELQRFDGHQYLTEDIMFCINDTKILGGGSGEDVLKLWDINSGNLDKIYKPVNVNPPLEYYPPGYLGENFGATVEAISISPDGKYFITGNRDRSIKIWNFESESEIKTLNGHSDGVNAVCYNKKGDKIVSGSGDNTLKLWSVNTGSEIKTYKGHSSGIREVKFTKNDTRIMSAAYDGTLIIWDTDSGKEIAKLIAIDPIESVIILPDFYYSASLGAYKGVSFTLGNKVFPFEQFDLRLNRPDIVIERLGYASPLLINSYKKAYLKRLKKMNFTEEMLGNDFHLPEIQIMNNDIPVSSESKSLTFKIQASDSKYPLDRLNVFINDVPVYGIKGIDLRNNKVSTHEEEITLQLLNGDNKIQVSVLNSKGVESLKETFYIKHSGPDVKPDLYIISIGVSEFVDNQYNLTYAAKDANDMVNTYKQNGSFGKVTEMKFTDANAIKKSVLKAKDVLMNSKVDDMVILFVASHGLLSENMDYFIASHDVDFNSPDQKGIPYDDLETLLDGIPALKKVMLIDACHSGEVDKDEMVLAEASAEMGAVKSRGFKAVKTKENQLGVENSFELMRELFADLRRGTGAAVISSAGGAEFAFESSEWQNGVFTYAVLEGLKTGNADANKDGEIVISELRNYVFDRVKELTNGKQNPTSRRENLEFDFRVW